MKAVDLIRNALQASKEGTLAIVDEMRSAPLTQPTSTGGNHPLWVMGHLAFVEGSMSHILFGEANPVEHWKPLFAPGSQPQTDASVYPSFDETVNQYTVLRDRTIGWLGRLESKLDDAPKAIPPGFEEAMRTIGDTLILICLHNMVHYGQIADARRVAGLKPLL